MKSSEWIDWCLLDRSSPALLFCSFARLNLNLGARRMDANGHTTSIRRYSLRKLNPDPEPALPAVTSKRKSSKRKRTSLPIKSELTSTEKSLSLLPEPEPSFTEDEIKYVQDNLLQWYRDNFRILPWRSPPKHNSLSSQSPDAYKIWVSEIMLQQTQVSVVIEYFNRWMKRFPTVAVLAESSLEDVNSIWAGLGYYRRARMLHDGARFVMDKYNGIVPDEVSKLLEIPGIGTYTAGAIASIAFKKQSAAVDGNVVRVLSRLLCLNGSTVSSKHWKLAESLVCDLEDLSGDFNQALMEHGALICVPRLPKCKSCCLQNICGAYKGAMQNASIRDSEDEVIKFVTRFPGKSVKAKVREEIVSSCVVKYSTEHESRYLMIQRPSNGLLANLWEFPSLCVDTKENTNADEFYDRMISMLETLLNDSIEKSMVTHCGVVKHKFSHIHQSINVYSLHLKTDPDVTWRKHTQRVADKERNKSSTFEEIQSTKWVSSKGLKTLPVSTQMRKVLDSVLKNG